MHPILTTPYSDTMSEIPSELPQISEDAEQALSLNVGYKIVLDKNVKPRYSPNKSLHYVQAYAVKDRISISDQPRTEYSAYDILPSRDDYESLKIDSSVLISRQIVKHMPFFTNDFKGPPLEHILVDLGTLPHMFH